MQNMPPQQQPQPGGGPPNLANLITSLDGPALQKLLGAMGQNPQTPQTPQTPSHPQPPPPPNQQRPGPTQDLASLLKSVAQQQPQPQQQGYSYGLPPQQQNTYQPPTPTQGYANMQGQQPYGGRPPTQGMPQQYGQPGQAPQQNVNVQDMLAQLAKYRQ